MRLIRAAELRAGDMLVVGGLKVRHRLVHVSVIGENVNIVAEKQSWRVGSHDYLFMVLEPMDRVTERSEHGQTIG